MLEFSTLVLVSRRKLYVVGNLAVNSKPPALFNTTGKNTKLPKETQNFFRQNQNSKKLIL